MNCTYKEKPSKNLEEKYRYKPYQKKTTTNPLLLLNVCQGKADFNTNIIIYVHSTNQHAQNIVNNTNFNNPINTN